MTHKGSGFLIAGVITLMASGAAYLLRETKGRPLLETIEDTKIIQSGTYPAFRRLSEALTQTFVKKPRRGFITDRELPMQGRTATVPDMLKIPELVMEEGGDPAKSD